MAGPEFFQTPMGRRFFESQLPNLTKAINRLADVKEAELMLKKEKEKTNSKYDIGKLRQEICAALTKYDMCANDVEKEDLYAALRLVHEHWSDIVGE